MEYIIEYYKKEQISQLRDRWLTLERGTEMTWFQTYAWHYMLVSEGCIPEDTNYCKFVYAAVKTAKNEIQLIAPFWIITKTFNLINKKGVYFIDSEGFSDYLNFVYDDFHEEMVFALMKDIKSTFGVSVYKLYQLRESSSTYHFLLEYTTIRKDLTDPCVNMVLPKSNEEYKGSLSKNTRQNLRTANNRLRKDGITLVFNHDNDNVDIDECCRIREERLRSRYSKVSKIRKMKHRLVNRLKYHLPQYLPLYICKEGHFLTAYHENELCAYFFYVRDEIHHQLLFLTAGTNSKYARYSAGMLCLYDFIHLLIDENNLELIDFTRGDEQYKLYMGGEANYNHKVDCVFK